MRLLTLLSALIVSAALLASCSVKPPARMAAYLGPGVESAQTTQLDLRALGDGQLQAGLLLINDTSFPDSAPGLSEHGLAFLSDAVRQRIEGGTPIRITKILPSSGVTPESAQQAVTTLGRAQDVPYVLMVIFSSMESEVAAMLPLMGDPQQYGAGGNEVSGYEAINYALAELALVEMSSGKVVARSDGRAWSRLNRLYVPVKSNAYPVIHRSLRVAPIFPKEKDAKDVLRSIAGDEALEQAVYKLELAWPKPA